MNRGTETIRRAFAEFLAIPTVIVAAFLMLAAGTSFLDHADPGWLHPLREQIRDLFFRDAQATSDLLATIAGSVITVTSITFSLLLLAVQQAAAALTSQVYDQFLRRRVNQVYFGFFIGLAIYALIILATVDRPYNPVFGATLVLALTVVALMLMLLLLYTTINQMRPEVVVAAIHGITLTARDRQRVLVSTTRRTRRESYSVSISVLTQSPGYVVRMDVSAMEAAARSAGIGMEVVIRVSVGAFVAFEDVLAEVWSTSSVEATGMVEAVQQAIHIEQRRDLDQDAAYGIEQLAMIGWTSISTAKSNPSPGLLVIRSLRDLLARWSADAADGEAELETQNTVSVVYTDDVFAQLLDAFERLAVVASESMQSQTVTEIIRTFVVMFDRLPADRQPRVEDLVRRTLSALGDHVLTADLDDAIVDLVRVLDSAGRGETAAEIRIAHETLATSVGRLGSRATRVGVTRA